MSTWIESLESEGFTVELNDVADEYLNNYGTNQRFETYKFYTVYREETDFPTLK